MKRRFVRQHGKTGFRDAFGLALAMPSVTAAFARAMAQAAGMTLRDDGALVSGGVVVRRLPQPTDGRLTETDYFDFLDWIRRQHEDEVALLEAYAKIIRADDIGVLGLSMKTAPTLRASLERLERYWRVVTDTAIYRLDESGDPACLLFEARTEHHPVLEFRNEGALAGSRAQYSPDRGRRIGPRTRLVPPRVPQRSGSLCRAFRLPRPLRGGS